MLDLSDLIPACGPNRDTSTRLGTDMYLMPSRDGVCDLNLLASFRYRGHAQLATHEATDGI